MIRIIAVLAIAASPFSYAAEAASRRPPSLSTLLSECGKDLRQNPAVFSCPGGCTVRVYNNPDPARAPIIQISPECSALRQAQGRPLR